MRKAVVVGASSMLGKRLIESLRNKHVSILTCGRSDQHDIRCDLGTQATVAVPIGFEADTLFHCAASFSDNSLEGYYQNEQVNVLGAVQIASLANSLQCQTVVNAGSIYSGLVHHHPMYSSYASSKGRGEELLEELLNRQRIRFVSVRLPQLYDERGECCQHQPWFGRIIAYASEGLKIRIPLDPGPRHFLHVFDAARCMIAAAERPVRGILTVAHPTTTTYHQIAECAYKVFGRTGSYETAREKQGFPSFPSIPSETLVKSLGIAAPLSMHDGIEMIRELGTAGTYGPRDVV